jgi:predicted phosphoadenosine phosphosulfate sulfurtransferase
MEAIKFSNINKPSNKKWKAIADFFLFTLPLYLTAIMALPIDENIKLWVTFIVTIIVISLKGFTKFTAEDPK